MLARLLVLTQQIERHAGADVRVERIGRTVERLSIQRERLLLLALEVQLARLLDELERIDLLSRGRRQNERDGENGRQGGPHAAIMSFLQADRFVDRRIASDRI